MLKTVQVPIDEIYVPVGQRKELDSEKTQSRINELLEEAQQLPVHVREGKGRYVLVKGLHRLEAAKAVGETTIDALIVQAPLH